MAIVIKEIHVHTVVEKKMVHGTDISDSVYQKIKEEVLRQIPRQPAAVSEIKKKER